jgi:hypothetical protein
VNDGDGSGGNDLVRSFLGSYQRDGDEDGADAANIVRPYTITGGRTAASRDDVRFETIVIATAEGNEVSATATTPEVLLLLEHADRPRSIVEVAHRAELPLGVALVLAGDAVEAGWLRCSAKVAHDRSFVQRVREGVRAL